MQPIVKTLNIPETMGGLRLDQALAKLLPEFSRTQIQDWIKNKNILVDGEVPKSRLIVLGGETIAIDATLKVQPTWEAQEISLDIIYEDEELLVINKPAGMVVHPAAGNFDSTLLNALLYHAPCLQQLPRAGIIHRLDKETTGLLVIAKTTDALQKLTLQLKERSMGRIYQAIVNGALISGGTVDAPIGRHHIQRKRMTVIPDTWDNPGKPAVTHYRVMERYRAHTRLTVQLETGRTHQIRVHMAYIHHAILGDPVYGGRLQLPKGASPELVHTLRHFKRQALHAFELNLIHPKTGKSVSWRAPLPTDMKELIHCLKEDALNEE